MLDRLVHNASRLLGAFRKTAPLSALTWLAAGVCGFALVWQTLWCAPVADSPAHLASGIATLRTGDPAFYRVNPPLHRLVSAVAVDATIAPEQKWFYAASLAPSGKRQEFQLGWRFVQENCSTYHRSFIAGRLARIPFVLLGGWLLLSMLRPYGHYAGPVAAVLWWTSPLVLGHGWAIMPDALSGVAACALLASTLAWLRRRTVSTWLMAGLSWGIALATKFTFCPVFILWPAALFAHDYLAGRRRWENYVNLMGGHLLHGAVALVVIALVYGGSDVGVRLGEHGFRSERLSWIRSAESDASENTSSEKAVSLIGRALAHIPSPLPKQYLVGIDEQQLDLERGLPTYVLGAWYPDGVWWYYAAAYLIKEQLIAWLGLGSIVIVVAGIVIRGRRSKWREASGERRERGQQEEPGTGDPAGPSPAVGSSAADEAIRAGGRTAALGLMLFGAAIVFGILSWHSEMALNARYLFPALPMVYAAIGLSGEFLLFWLPGRLWPRRVLLALLAVGIAEAILAFPHHFAYASPIVGGADRVPPALHDTNFDSGQDLWRLSRWLGENEPTEGVTRWICIEAGVPEECRGVEPRLPDENQLRRFLAGFHRPAGQAETERGGIELIVQRALTVPAPWTDVAGAVGAEKRRIGALLRRLAGQEPDGWITPTIVIYRSGIAERRRSPDANSLSL